MASFTEFHLALNPSTYQHTIEFAFSTLLSAAVLQLISSDWK